MMRIPFISEKMMFAILLAVIPAALGCIDGPPCLGCPDDMKSCGVMTFPPPTGCPIVGPCVLAFTDCPTPAPGPPPPPTCPVCPTATPIACPYPTLCPVERCTPKSSQCGPPPPPACKVPACPTNRPVRCPPPNIAPPCPPLNCAVAFADCPC